MNDKNKIWFPAKKYGWGWGMPCAWQGWFVTAVFFSLLALTFVYFPPQTSELEFGALVFLESAALMALCWWKGETPKWRWGDD